MFDAPGARGRQFRSGRPASLGQALIRPSAIFILGILLVTGPWLARNYLLTGSPFFTLQKYEPAMFTATHPQYSLYMLPEQFDVAGFIRTHPAEMAAKVAAAWTEYRGDYFAPAFTGVAPGVLILFLLSLLLPLGLWFPSQRGVRLLLAGCYLLQLAVLLPLHYIDRLFIIFAPFFMLYASAGVWALGRLAAAGIWGRLQRPPELRGGVIQQVLGPDRRLWWQSFCSSWPFLPLPACGPITPISTHPRRGRTPCPCGVGSPCRMSSTACPGTRWWHRTSANSSPGMATAMAANFPSLRSCCHNSTLSPRSGRSSCPTGSPGIHPVGPVLAGRLPDQTGAGGGVHAVPGLSGRQLAVLAVAQMLSVSLVQTVNPDPGPGSLLLFRC